MIPRPPADPTVLVPTSAVLQRLHDEVPTDHFTLGWLMRSLRKRSFGIIMLLLALVAIVPGLYSNFLHMKEPHQGVKIGRRTPIDTQLAKGN